MILRPLSSGGSWGGELYGRVTAGGARWESVLTGVTVRSSCRLPARQPGRVRGSAPT